MGSCDGLVLAGGQGRRFGRPKASVLLGGTTLVERALAQLVPRCGEVVVVSRPEVPLPPLDARVVMDKTGPAGPLTALATGLSEVTAGDVVVLACDLPFAGPLVDRMQAYPAGTTVAMADESGTQPLCARYSRQPALDSARDLLDRGELRLRPLLEVLDATILRTDGPELHNVNSWPDALAAEIGHPPLSPEVIDLVLDLTRMVAHGTERRNGPLAAFLAGYHMGVSKSPLTLGTGVREATDAAAALLAGDGPPPATAESRAPSRT